ncbi:MarR family transcriptional regulator [Gordonia sp. Z-3]|uniref:MarR family transcriptional regulator n=1 Tax=Gordonia tangerina TaxID=2911060 RepID=A0ABS9DQX7_9ACTN|nr:MULTISPECIES: MarR family transcriptional regulator [Gordonia]MAU84443.1 MarR family transcriptional regulator [Gordonia sp. (in: high G+C Gram-positive bacteria)]MCF3940218.1 MarR family transcriptional regulator [Gordonia tangerina]MED5799522.1 MarR family transcriptional regulator [Gordonia sp. Z-3]
MDHASLTPSQSAVLFVLLSQAREVPNPELRRLAPELTRRSRETLNDLGLIESVRGPRNSYVHALTDRGWAWCSRELAADPPHRSQPPIRALYAVMAAIGRYLDTEDLRLHEVFRPAEQPITEQPDTEPSGSDRSATIGIESRIRSAYHDLAPRPGAWVAVAALRTALSDEAADTVDDALVNLQRSPGVSLIPQEDRALLSRADRDAAVVVGTQECHLFAIEEL